MAKRKLSKKAYEALLRDPPPLHEVPPELRVAPDGVHDDVVFQQYLWWDAIGSGGMRKCGRSPLHFHHDQTNDARIAKSIMAAGRGLHACVLEADTTWPRFVRMEEGLTRVNKEYKELVKEHGKDWVLRADEYDACLGGRDQLMKHSRIGRLMKKGRPEVSFAWTDPETGIEYKGRADWLSEGIRGDAVVDLKQTGSPQRFRSIARDKGYPLQGSHYLRGLNHHGIAAKHYVVVAVEATPPYAPIIYRVSTRDLIIAEDYWDAVNRLLAWCRENETWPAYRERVEVLDMGNWWAADIQDRIAQIEERIA